MTQITNVESLVEWLSSRPAKEFPEYTGFDYPRRFASVAEYLEAQVHSQVEKGAVLNKAGYLTDHGPNHIATVIQRASKLLSYPNSSYPQISAYEAYLLCLAIHFHDVGNIFGREEHEQRHKEVMDKIAKLVGDEMVERQAILKIARAHGGKIGDNKDTISVLPRVDQVLGHDVRYQSLAAIL
ncbi:MAG: hypothetical protein KDA72_15845, partial [Planctomycetales bacterium]|nr:hypothetical protein [Planctomycetales bacterium]